MSVVKMRFFFFFKQKTAYEMRISDWSSDVCSSDLVPSAKRSPSTKSRSKSEPSVFRSSNAKTGRKIFCTSRICSPMPISAPVLDRKSVVSGKSVSVRVDLGGLRIINKKKYQYKHIYLYFFLVFIDLF